MNAIKKILITLVTIYLIANTSLSFCCQTPDFDYWLAESSKTLKQNGCVREHVRLAIANSVNNYEKVISISEHLKSKGILDANALKLEAIALYKDKKFEKALEIYLESEKTPANCKILTRCGFEYDAAIEHYTRYQYFLAAKREVDAQKELDKGDIEFTKICTLNGKNSAYCQGVRDNVFQYLND